ncbi:MAG: FHIPEP family type III secretion protein [Gemmatimonadaceae bacterium]|nr:FHIPEP family type III secretion protein [Gemmatimonadaceae bacterium]
MTSAALPLPGSANKARLAEIGVAVVVVLILALIVVPLPAPLLDLCLAASIGISLAVLLVALYTTNPLDFSSFPALILLLTLFRIGLNVSSTRLILTEAHAGKVIEAFGKFVIGGNYAVGVVIFLILIGINFIVITKGAGRIAEVAARFTLDAMPGKQMAIDADLSAGLIDEKEARQRRDEIARTADFYGAMDGASKYVKGDAILGILVVIINVVGGIFIGVIQRGMDIGKAASTYTILTVGDGLVSQVPALIISTAAGLMVTAATSTDKMGAVLSNQLGAHPRSMWIVAGVLAAFGFIPALPTFPSPASLGAMPAPKLNVYGPANVSIQYTLNGGADGDGWIDLYVYRKDVGLAEEAAMTEELILEHYAARRIAAPTGFAEADKSASGGWYDATIGGKSYLTHYQLSHHGEWAVKARFSMPVDAPADVRDRAAAALAAPSTRWR